MRISVPHAAHWGSLVAEVEDDRLVGVRPHVEDPAPSPLLANMVASAHHRSRVAVPAVRRGWLEGGPGPDERRGSDEWVAVGWDQAIDLVAGELTRVTSDFGSHAIYAGSYGWASAGRFHHCQSQLRRFFNLIGDPTVSVGTYSTGAAEVLLPHVLGDAGLWRDSTPLTVVAAETDLMVCFGGLPKKNTGVAPGGLTRHTAHSHLLQAVQRGMKIVSVSPIQDDAPEYLNAEWLPNVPGTDVAMMAALAFVLVDAGLADLDWCRRYCTGTDRLVAYLTGRTDGVVKSPRWAADLCGIAPGRIEALARQMVAGRTLVTSSWSLQRAEYGEQVVWMTIALAALLGQVGLPGGGFGHGYSSMADIGGERIAVSVPGLPGAAKPLSSWIPVARVADMLLRPGETYNFDGATRTYPEIHLVYWAGGNPFHHHQDLGRLTRAFRRAGTIVVHEAYWTPTARHADIVLPATITLERNDLGWGKGDRTLIAMHQALRPLGEARNDHDIFADLAERFGKRRAFTEERRECEWLERIYDQLRSRLASLGVETPPFDAFWHDGALELPVAPAEPAYLSEFRREPHRNRLRTPSGKIELFSETIARFGYPDCPPHPMWIEPTEWTGGERAAQFPLLLIANNPATRLHSQMDQGCISQNSKVAGREPLRMHPLDAAPRLLSTGDIALVNNDRGSCLAGVVVSESVKPGVVQLSTGAWYDPVDFDADRPFCAHGNPNVLTPDVGTSQLAQACSGQHVLVEVTRFDGRVPPVRAHEPPALTAGDPSGRY